MIPYFSIEFFNIGPFRFYVWGFFVSLAFLVGLILSWKQAKKIGIAPARIFYLILFVYLGAIFGARLLYYLQWPTDFFADFNQIFKVGQGGMMFYGGLLGGMLAGWWYIRKWETRQQLVNALAPIIPFSMAIGRVGCFLLNDHKGAAANVSWAILWPDGILRQPVALYLILFDLALAGFLWWYSRRHSEDPPAGGDEESLTSHNNKKTFILFFLLYPLGRFFLDFTRNASADPHFWGLAASQWISLVLFTIISVSCIIRFWKSESSFFR